jgi:GTP-binding protein
VNRKLRLRPRVLTASAKTGRNIERILQEAVGLADRSRGRIPTPQLNRFISDIVAARQPPSSNNHRHGNQRLKLIYMTQTAERPPRFSIQVNSHALVTRDYAYYLENRMRERYRMEGIPLMIDFVERNERRGRSARSDRDFTRAAERNAANDPELDVDAAEIVDQSGTVDELAIVDQAQLDAQEVPEFEFGSDEPIELEIGEQADPH